MIVRTVRDVGASIRDARKRKGWTQAELAQQIGASRQWVIALERGKSAAELSHVLKAFAALGCALDVVPVPPQTGNVDLDDLLDRF